MIAETCLRKYLLLALLEAGDEAGSLGADQLPRSHCLLLVFKIRGLILPSHSGRGGPVLLGLTRPFLEHAMAWDE